MLQHLIERRIAACGRIKELERKKQAAVLEEDYDCAKSCKVQCPNMLKSIYRNIGKEIQYLFSLEVKD